MDDRIKKIADHYGFEAQSRQLIEEMAELTQAINKEWRRDKGYLNGDEQLMKASIIEELADVLVMINQMCHLLDCAEMVTKTAGEKIDRTLERIQLYPFSRCLTCGKEFNSELVYEYGIKCCPWCGEKIEGQIDD